MTHPEIIKSLTMIERSAIEKNPILALEIVRQHLRALINILTNDAETELQQAQKELNTHVPEYTGEKSLNTDQALYATDLINEAVEQVGYCFDEMNEGEDSATAIEKNEKRKSWIISRIKDRILNRVPPTLPLIQVHAVMNFYLANDLIHKDRLIEQVFEGCDPYKVETYQEVFKAENYDLNKLLFHLNNWERAKLILWIMERYNAFPVEVVKELINE